MLKAIKGRTAKAGRYEVSSSELVELPVAFWRHVISRTLTRRPVRTRPTDSSRPTAT